jgi:hypothetical protein
MDLKETVGKRGLDSSASEYLVQWCVLVYMVKNM